MIVCGR